MSKEQAELRRWLEEVTDPELSAELLSIRNEEKEVHERFYRSLEFGTGGLRGELGAGTNRMNIYTVRQATQGFAAYLLTQEEKIQMCQLVTEAGADFIKTSTGFSTGGATRADVLLFKSYIGKEVKIKAAGGIRSMWDAEEFIRLGCERLGTSSVVKMVKEAEKIGRLR